MKSSGVEDKNQFIPNPYPKKQSVIRRPSPMDHNILKEAFQIDIAIQSRLPSEFAKQPEYDSTEIRNRYSVSFSLETYRYPT